MKQLNFKIGWMLLMGKTLNLVGFTAVRLKGGIGGFIEKSLSCSLLKTFQSPEDSCQ